MACNQRTLITFSVCCQRLINVKLNHFTSDSLVVCYPSGVEIEIKIKKREIKYEILKSITLLSTVEVMGKTELALIGFHFHNYSFCIDGLNNMVYVISFIFVRFYIKYCKMDEKIFLGRGRIDWLGQFQNKTIYNAYNVFSMVL